MKTPATYTSAGAKATTAVKLQADIFGIEVINPQLIKDSYNAYLANGRDNLAVTKTRGLVRGGGKKPWKQKGTGRARFGSSRVPLWRGGGVIFGPTGQENYTKKVNISTKRTALRHALTLKNESNAVSVIASINTTDAKTSVLAKLLGKVGALRNTLLVVEAKTDAINRMASNMPKVTVVAANYVNVFLVMNADSIVIEQNALTAMNDWLTATKTAKEKPVEKVAPKKATKKEEAK